MTDLRTPLAVSPLVVFALLLAGVIALAAWRWQEDRRLEEIERDDSPLSVSIARLRELEALANLGPGALEEILQALDDPDVRGQRAAINALGRLGPDARPAAGRLAGFLDLADQDPVTCSQALEALYKVGNVPDAAVPRIAGLRLHADASLRAAATDLLDSLDDMSVSRAVDRADQSAQRNCLLLELAKRALPDNEALLANLHDMLGDPAMPDRVQLECFMLISAVDRLTHDELSQALRSQHRDMLDLALRQVELMGPRAAEHASAVGRQLLQKDPSRHSGALAALRAMGTAGRHAIPFVQELLRLVDARQTPDPQSQQDHDRGDALRTLRALGEPGQQLVQYILLHAENGRLDAESAALLAELDPQAAKTLSARYVPLAYATGRQSKQKAVLLLGALRADDGAAIDALCAVAADESIADKSGAIQALSRIGRRAARGVPLLQALLARSRVQLRRLDDNGPAHADSSPSTSAPRPAHVAHASPGQPSRDEIERQQKLQQELERNRWNHASLLDALVSIAGPTPELRQEIDIALVDKNWVRRGQLLYTRAAACDDGPEFLEVAAQIVRLPFHVQSDKSWHLQFWRRLDALPRAKTLYAEVAGDAACDRSARVAAAARLYRGSDWPVEPPPELNSLIDRALQDSPQTNQTPRIAARPDQARFLRRAALRQEVLLEFCRARASIEAAGN
jgi:hypothetical protein